MADQLKFSPRQKTTITAAITLAAALGIIATAVLALLGLSRFVAAFQQVLMPPVLALFLALLLQPVFDLFMKISRGSRVAALILLFLAAVIPLGLLIWLGTVYAVNQIPRLIEDLSALLPSMWETVQSLFAGVQSILEQIGLESRLDEVFSNPGDLFSSSLNNISSAITGSAQGLAASITDILAWLVTPVYLVFFLLAPPFDIRMLHKFLPFLKKRTRKDVVYLADQFISILLTFFRGQILIALLQGILFGLGFALVGLPYGAVIGFVLGLLNIIPYLGSLLGMAVAIPMALFSSGGGIGLGLLVLLVFAIVQAIESYLLTPRIMGNRTGLHPALIIFSVFFWGTALGGVFGMMLAIPLTAFIVVFWRLLKKKYIQELI